MACLTKAAAADTAAEELEIYAVMYYLGRGHNGLEWEMRLVKVGNNGVCKVNRTDCVYKHKLRILNLLRVNGFKVPRHGVDTTLSVHLKFLLAQIQSPQIKEQLTV